MNEQFEKAFNLFEKRFIAKIENRTWKLDAVYVQLSLTGTLND